MNKSIKKYSFLVLLIVFVGMSNYYSYLYIGLVDGGISKRYKFETFDGKHQFLTIPSKGTDIKTMELKFVHFCKENPQYEKTDLYRTFGRNPLKYWRWHEFLTHPRYKYKYKKPSKDNFNHFTIGRTKNKN